MRFLIGGAGALLVVASILVFVPREKANTVSDLRGQAEVSVVLTDKGFEPDTVRITKGTKVTFTTTRRNQFWPASNPHPSHEIYPTFEPKEPISPSGSWSFVFDQVGIWGYHDHVRSYFTGTLYVEE